MSGPEPVASDRFHRFVYFTLGDRSIRGWCRYNLTERVLRRQRSPGGQSCHNIFSIFYDTYFNEVRKKKPSDVRELAERKLGKMYLDDPASLSGGRVVEPEKAAGGLNAAFKAIAEELSQQYSWLLSERRRKPRTEKESKSACLS